MRIIECGRVVYNQVPTKRECSFVAQVACDTLSRGLKSRTGTSFNVGGAERMGDFDNVHSFIDSYTRTLLIPSRELFAALLQLGLDVHASHIR